MTIKLEEISNKAIINVRENKKDINDNKEYNALCENIELNGVLTPVILRKLSEEQQKKYKAVYGIIDGNLRFQAVCNLHKKYPNDKKWNSIFAVVSKNEIEDRMYGLIANFSKVEMEEIEKAEIVFEMLQEDALDVNGKPILMTGGNKNKHKKISQAEVGKRLGISSKYVSKLLLLYKKQVINKNNEEASLESKYFELKDDKYTCKLENIKTDIESAVKSITTHLSDLDNVDNAMKAADAVKEAKKILAEIEAEIKNNPVVVDKLSEDRNSKIITNINDKIQKKEAKLAKYHDQLQGEKNQKKIDALNEKINKMNADIEKLNKEKDVII